jgi:hypothetical protein
MLACVLQAAKPPRASPSTFQSTAAASMVTILFRSRSKNMSKEDLRLCFCGDEHVSRDDTLQLHSLSSSNRANSTHRQKSLVVLCRTWPMTVSRYNVRFWISKHPAVHWLSYSSYIKVGCWRSRRGTAMMRCPIVATYQQTSVHWTGSGNRYHQWFARWQNRALYWRTSPFRWPVSPPSFPFHPQIGNPFGESCV